MPKLFNFTISLLMIYFLFRLVWWIGNGKSGREKEGKKKESKMERNKRWDEEFDEMEEEIEDLGW